jgi:hypothetical protein
MSTIRLPKSEVYDDDLHTQPYLVWIKTQSDSISEFANVVGELQDETKRKVVQPFKVNSCAAGLASFYSKNIAFKAIYEEYAAQWKQKADDLYATIYLDTKSLVTDYETPIGKKYKKKDATQAEIDLEMRLHVKYPEYVSLLEQHRGYESKAKTQSKFLDVIGGIERVLKLLQQSMVTELKFLYLE